MGKFANTSNYNKIKSIQFISIKINLFYFISFLPPILVHTGTKCFLKYLGFGPRGHSRDPPPPGWTSVDFWLTPPPPLLVHVVVECPLTALELFENSAKMYVSPFEAHIPIVLKY